MELGGGHIAVGVDAAKGHVIFGDAGDGSGVVGSGEIAVDEVEVAVLGDALKDGVRLLEGYGVPTHVRDFEAGGKLFHSSRDDAQTGGVALFGVVQKELESEADAEKRFAGGDVFSEGSGEAAGVEGFHGGGAGTDPGKDNGVGVAEQVRVAGDKGIDAGGFQGLGHAAEVARLVVNDNDFQGAVHDWPGGRPGPLNARCGRRWPAR